MKELILAWAILHGADAVTTVQALHSGLREGNPLLPQNPVANVAISTAATGLAMWSARRLERTHPKLARGLVIGIVGEKGIVVGWNIRTLVDAPPR